MKAAGLGNIIRVSIGDKSWVYVCVCVCFRVCVCLEKGKGTMGLRECDRRCRAPENGRPSELQLLADATGVW